MTDSTFEHEVLHRLESASHEVITRLDSVQKTVDRMDSILTGGDEPDRGLVVRVDRLQQTEARRDKWTVGIGVTSVGAALHALRQWLSQ